METHHDSRPHPRVRASPEVGPGATVGTPGLGYPLLLCLGEKSFVVILNYVQRPDLCGPKALFAQQRSRTHPLVGKGLGAPRVPGEADAQPEQPGDPDLPWKSGPPRSPGPPQGSGTLNSNRTPHRGKESAPLPGGGPEPTRVYKHRHVYKVAWSPYQASPTAAFIVVDGRPHCCSRRRGVSLTRGHY